MVLLTADGGVRLRTRAAEAPPENIAPILAPMSAVVLDNAAIGTSLGTADLANSPYPPPEYSIEAGPVAIDSLTGAMSIDDTVTAGTYDLDVTAETADDGEEVHVDFTFYPCGS